MIKSKYDECYDEANVKKFNEERNDWTATCRICRQHISGTLAELRKHICNHNGK